MSHAIADDQGLICAFQIAPVEPCGPEVLERGPPRPAWLHFNLSNTKARRWLDEGARLPEPARELLRSTDRRVHTEVMPEGLMLVLGDLDHDFHGDPEGFHTLFIYVDEERLITARRHPLKTPDHLRRELQ